MRLFLLLLMLSIASPVWAEQPRETWHQVQRGYDQKNDCSWTMWKIYTSDGKQWWNPVVDPSSETNRYLPLGRTPFVVDPKTDWKNRK